MPRSILKIAAPLLLLAGCAHTTPPTVACACAPSAVTQATPGSEQDLVANVGDRVFFAFNKSNLSPAAAATLTRQTTWLATYPGVNVLVAGNADERGTETYNLALGARRADVVRNNLVASGVAATRIQTISYGKDRPIAPGNDDAAYQKNRTTITSVQGFNPQAQ